MLPKKFIFFFRQQADTEPGLEGVPDRTQWRMGNYHRGDHSPHTSPRLQASVATSTGLSKSTVQRLSAMLGVRTLSACNTSLAVPRFVARVAWPGRERPG